MVDKPFVMQGRLIAASFGCVLLGLHTDAGGLQRADACGGIGRRCQNTAHLPGDIHEGA